MIAAFAQLTSTDTGIVLVGALCLFGWIVGIVFALALVWPRIASTRGRTVSADGRCTCRALDEAHADIRDLYRQNARLAVRVVLRPSSSRATASRTSVDPWGLNGIGA